MAVRTIKFTWSAVPDVDGYNIYINESGSYTKDNGSLIGTNEYTKEFTVDNEIKVYLIYVESVKAQTISFPSNVLRLEISDSVLFVEDFDDYEGEKNLPWIDTNTGTPIGGLLGSTASPRVRIRWEETSSNQKYVQIKYVPTTEGTERITHPFQFFRFDTQLAMSMEYDLLFETIWSFETFGEDPQNPLYPNGFPYQTGKLHGLGPHEDVVVTGGDPVNSEGWSVRLTWLRNVNSHNLDPADPNYNTFLDADKWDQSESKPTISLYIHDQDKVGSGGVHDPVLQSDAQNGFTGLDKNIWYTVKLTVQINDPGKSNGTAKLEFFDRATGNKLAEKYREDVKFRNVDTENSKPQLFLFNTFFGGGSVEFAPPYTIDAQGDISLNQTEWEDGQGTTYHWSELVDFNNGLFARNDNYKIKPETYYEAPVISSITPIGATSDVTVSFSDPNIENADAVEYQIVPSAGEYNRDNWVSTAYTAGVDAATFTLSGLSDSDKLLVRVAHGDRYSARSDAFLYSTSGLSVSPTGVVRKIDLDQEVYNDGDAITTISDESSFAQDFTANGAVTFKTGIINGKPVMRFTTAGGYMESPNTGLTNITNEMSLFVVSAANGDNQGSVFCTSPFDTSMSINAHIPYTDFSGDDILAFEYGDRSQERISGFWNSSFNTFYLWEFKVRNGEMTIYRNGDLFYILNSSDVADLTAKVLRLGWFPDGIFDGDIAYFLLYSRYLDNTSDDRTAILEDVSAKFNIPIVYPQSPQVNSFSVTGLDSSIQFNWNVNERNGDLTQIEISVNGAWETIGPTDNVGSFIKTGLVNGDPYNLIMRFTNSVGVATTITEIGTPVAISPVITSINALDGAGNVFWEFTPGKPTFTVTGINGGLSIVVTDANDGNSNITQWAYSVVPTGDPASFANTTVLDSFEVTGLSDGTTYDVQLRGTNAIGEGLASEIVQGSPVSEYKIDLGTGSNRISWTEPAEDVYKAIVVMESNGYNSSSNNEGFFNSESSVPYMLTGPVSGSVDNEVLTLYDTTPARTYTTDNIPSGLIELSIEWNAGSNKYEFFVDGSPMAMSVEGANVGLKRWKEFGARNVGNYANLKVHSITLHGIGGKIHEWLCNEGTGLSLADSVGSNTATIEELGENPITWDTV